MDGSGGQSLPHDSHQVTQDQDAPMAPAAPTPPAGELCCLLEQTGRRRALIGRPHEQGKPVGHRGQAERHCQAVTQDLTGTSCGGARQLRVQICVVPYAWSMH